MVEDNSLDSLISNSDDVLENAIFETVKYLSENKHLIPRYNQVLNQLYNAYNSNIVPMDEISEEIQEDTFTYFGKKTKEVKTNYFGKSALSTFIGWNILGFGANLIFDNSNFLELGLSAGTVFGANNIFWNWYVNKYESEGKSKDKSKLEFEERKNIYERLFHYEEEAWVEALDNLKPKLKNLL